MPLFDSSKLLLVLRKVGNRLQHIISAEIQEQVSLEQVLLEQVLLGSTGLLISSHSSVDTVFMKSVVS